jgi:hypothetical protein
MKNKNTPPKLLDQVRNRIRVKHYSIRTEKQYVQWIKRFILFHGKRHPQEMGAAEVGAFLTHLAVEGMYPLQPKTKRCPRCCFCIKRCY